VIVRHGAVLPTASGAASYVPGCVLENIFANIVYQPLAKPKLPL